MSGYRKSEVWTYFEKIKTDDHSRKATCKLCFDTYSYATTITNLKRHLHYKHRDICPSGILSEPSSKPANTKTQILFDYYTDIDHNEKLARCKICKKQKSFENSWTSLKSHLFKAHPDMYRQFQRRLPPIKAAISDSSDEEDAEDLQDTQKLSDIWNYFEQEGSRTRCVVCRELLTESDYEHLKAHLFEHHPKLLLHLVHDQDEKTSTKSQPASDAEDNDNTYTEVVYLEQDSAPEDTRTEKPKIINSFTQNRAKKRHRNNSSSDHPIIKLKKEAIIEEDSELEAFIKYIRCLLKKLQPNVFSKVQVDILKTIMDAQYSQKVSVTDTSAGTSIFTDMPNGSVANVIRVSEIASENNSILGNYTVTLAGKSDDVENNK